MLRTNGLWMPFPFVLSVASPELVEGRAKSKGASSQDAIRRGGGFSGDPADHPPAPDPVSRSTMPAMSMAPWASARSSTSKVDV